MSDRVLSLAVQAEEAARDLPIPKVAYFAIAFSLFVVALGVTWSFRNTAYKIQRPTHVDEHGRLQIEGGHAGSDGSHH
jgi:hypothetical protein